MIIFCDIDGTIADNSHRVGFIQVVKKDWETFYNPELMAQDKIILGAVNGLAYLSAGMKHRCYFLTGRPERTRKVTEEWLAKYDLYHPVLMRSDGDHRKAHVYKEEAIRKVAIPGQEMMFIDDDERNFDTYNRIGICLKAPECWDVIK